MRRDSTVLVCPYNDAEAVQIVRIARALGIETFVSDQPHGARLELEVDLAERLRATGKKQVAIVEMPGPEAERVLATLGFTIEIIDHHRYDDLDRMTDATGKPKASSLEQFLTLFEVNDAELLSQGFHPRLVRGVGAMDRGFMWALEHDGYTPDEVKAVSRYVYELSKEARGEELTELNEQAARRAWETRRRVGEYVVVTNDEPKAEIRPVVSLLIAQEFGQPTPTIVSSRGGLLLYVQDTPSALGLFQKFGGFTFGQDTCWGYNNATAKQKVTLESVLSYLQML